MNYRCHVHEEILDVLPEVAFMLLTTPSAICEWWGASRSIIVPHKNGIWATSWGEEDDPDYISAAILTEFDPPKRLTMKHGKYYAKTGPLPFEFAPDALTVFTITPDGDGCVLRVEQTGFPCDAIADEFYAACEIGWRNTFEGIRQFLEKQ